MRILRLCRARLMISTYFNKTKATILTHNSLSISFFLQIIYSRLKFLRISFWLKQKFSLITLYLFLSPEYLQQVRLSLSLCLLRGTAPLSLTLLVWRDQSYASPPTHARTSLALHIQAHINRGSEEKRGRRGDECWLCVGAAD